MSRPQARADGAHDDAPDADDTTARSAEPPARSRRGLLVGAAAAVASGAAGIALGYRFRTELRDVKLRALAYPLSVPGEMDAFRREAARIDAARARQTAEDVAALKARYESAVFGRVRVWDLVEKLALCVDASDRRLFCASQFVHVQQILAAMEHNAVDDPDMLLLAIVHDLGKVLLLAAEAPENVVGVTRRISGGEEGAGLDRTVFQFGHGDFIASRIAGHVPEHVAWVARYHNVRLREATPLMDERERDWAERWLIPFRRFDGGFVSPYFLPRIDLTRYRELVERAFPSPLLV
jgi:hypothetical protein